MSRPHVPSLVAGLVVLVLGLVLALDAGGAIELSFAALGPLACGTVGAILLASGLSGRS